MEKKYYIIHVRHGRRDGEGYSVIIAIENGDEHVAIEQMIDKGYYDCIEDIHDIGYVREIGKDEYDQLIKQCHVLWENGCMLRSKIFSSEDLVHAKQLSYDNWEKESTDIGFEFHGQWITNPFLEASGRFEFKDQNAMYDYYSKDVDGRYKCGAKDKVYDFILKILELESFE